MNGPSRPENPHIRISRLSRIEYPHKPRYLVEMIDSEGQAKYLGLTRLKKGYWYTRGRGGSSWWVGGFETLDTALDHLLKSEESNLNAHLNSAMQDGLKRVQGLRGDLAAFREAAAGERVILEPTEGRDG